MSEYDVMLELYEILNGSEPSEQDKEHMQQEVGTAKKLRGLYETICKRFGARSQLMQLYAWDLAVAMDEREYRKAEALIGILETLEGEEPYLFQEHDKKSH